MRKHALLALSALALLVSSGGAARAAEKLRLERMDLKGSPTIKLYLTYVDGEGRAITGRAKEDFKIVVDSAEQGAASALQSFDESKEPINVVVVAQVGSAVGWLVPLDGPQTGELFQLKGRCIVGKAPDCDVVLNDPSISGKHAEFIAGRTGFRVNDLGSTNGTYVNDKKITNADLVDNDNVRLGRTNFKFKSMN